MVPALTGSATGDNLSKLQSKLGNAQSQLNGNKQQQAGLAGRVAELSSQVNAMSSRIQLVQSREAAARDRLTADTAKLTAVSAAETREQRHLRHVRHALGLWRRALAAELRSQYEQPQQSLISVVVDAKGFQQLLDTLQFQTDVSNREQTLISAARAARSRANRTAAHLVTLMHLDADAASAAQTQTSSLAGMNALLSSEQSALADARSAQSTALAASQARGAQLQAAIATIQKQEQAAEQAERTVSYGGAGGLGASAGWAIPYAIVLCESGGANLPPNRAGASGYYQILPSTWSEFGGSGPAAYLAPKSEQDAVAARIWNGGVGASNWACAAIVGVS